MTPDPELFPLCHATYLRLTDSSVPLPVRDLAKDLTPLSPGPCDRRRGLGSGIVLLLSERHRKRSLPSSFSWESLHVVFACYFSLQVATSPRAAPVLKRAEPREAGQEPWVPLTWSLPTLELLNVSANQFPHYCLSQHESGFSIFVSEITCTETTWATLRYTNWGGERPGCEFPFQHFKLGMLLLNCVGASGYR